MWRKPPIAESRNFTVWLSVLFPRGNMERPMGGNLIYYAIVFLIVALVAAALGFGGVAGTALSGAHLLLVVAVVLIVVGLLAGVLRRGL